MEEYRKSLYKERKQTLTSQEHNRLNRQLQEANRNKQRSDQYTLSRHISISPAPRIRLQAEKENVHENAGVVEEHHHAEGGGGDSIANSSRTAKVVCTARDPEKIKKQEAFILRFLDWKDKKKSLLEKKKNEANKKRPFVSAVSKNFAIGAAGPLAPVTTTNHHHTSIVPKGHHLNFEPPPGLREPDAIMRDRFKGRQSIYTVVPTPPKKTKATDECAAKKMSAIRKPLPTNLHIRAGKTNINNKTPARSEVGNKNAKPLSSGPKAKIATSNSASKPPVTTTAPKNLVKSLPNKNNLNVAATKTKPTTTTTTTTLKPRSLKMPPPIAPPVRRPTAASVRKTDVPAIKTNTAAARPKYSVSSTKQQQQRLNKKSPQQPQKNARLTQTMKAKKPTKPPNGASAKLLSLMVTESHDVVSNMIVQTPKDFSSSNHFDDFVTSTKVKNASQSLEDANGVSPIEMPSKRSHGNSSAKRNLLKEATANVTQTLSQVKSSTDLIKLPTTENCGSSKFNFIRYSVANTTLNDEDEDLESDPKPMEEEEAKEPDDDLINKDADRTLVVERSVHEERTPTKQPILNEDKPVNYLSPYVSVTRGKVSLKKEKEKRNSIYLVSPVEDELNCSVRDKSESPHKSPSTSPKYSAEVRRTLEAVRYFRKQLQDEIERLHQQCDVWEEYKRENLEKLQSANCDDMIDVTIGQTKLLTSKKFMQFKGLIDRCEARATGIGDVPNDGSEKTKDVAAVDLEGFWSMLGLQVDNLEKRFENLNRWKANDWQDPDEVKPKAKSKPKNLTKVKKGAPAAKAKPNSALQQMLRKMQAEMRNKKANNLLATTDDVILTPSKVRDRKFYSPAATVVAIPASNRRLSTLLRQGAEDSPNRRMSLLVRKSSQDSPNRRMSLLVRKNSQDTPTRRASLLARKNSQDSPSLLKSVLQFREVFDATLVEESSGGTKRNSVDTETAYNSPVVIKSRKSILKTPGTAKSKLKNVVFNEKLRVKKFNFMVDDTDADADDAEECNQSNEEDLAQNRQDTDEDAHEQDSAKLGTYSLRNRKVRLRPSCEIVIPK